MWFISWMNSWWSNAASTWSTSVGGWEPLETPKTNGFPKVLGMEILIRYEIHVWVLKFSDLMVSMKIMHKGKLQVYIYLFFTAYIYIYIYYSILTIQIPNLRTHIHIYIYVYTHTHCICRVDCNNGLISTLPHFQVGLKTTSKRKLHIYIITYIYIIHCIYRISKIST